MADPDLAARDPIFWLHHSNIDRLWQVWLDCDPLHQNLTTTYWLTGVPFQFHNATGAMITMRTAQVLNLTDPLLDYKYTDASCPTRFKVTRPPTIPSVPIAPAATTPAGPIISGPTVARQMATPQHELVGATLSAVRLDDQIIDVPLPTPVTPHDFRFAADKVAPAATAAAHQLVQNVTLHLEQVTSSDVSPAYDVFLNIPVGDDPNKHEDRFVGLLCSVSSKLAIRVDLTAEAVRTSPLISRSFITTSITRIKSTPKACG